MMEQSSAAEESCVPPGFRFHPTEEELVGYYLARKVAASHHKTMDLIDIIQEVDLYRIEPWDLQERCRAGGEQTAAEWYFFSYKDRKYPSGTRTNRATAAGFWKATGRDKPVLSSSSCRVIGMRKTLVFYKGRAPNGSKTHWIMHEYRLLQTNDHHAHAQEEGWVVCRAFQKPIPNQRPCSFFPSYGATPAGGYHEHEHLPPPNARLHVLADGAHHHHYFLHPAAGHAANGSSRSFPPPQLYSDDDESKAKQQRRLLLSTSLPQLESPTAIACAGAAAQQQGSSCYRAAAAENELIQGDRGGGQQAAAAGAAIDYYWSFLDTLLTTTSQLHEP